MTVVVVTDSSARVPFELREKWSIREVPLHILLGDMDFRDGVDQVPGDVHERGQATTAGATPEELRTAYRHALDDSGGGGVVAVHVSALLSGTFRAAEQAATDIGSAVRVIDSRSVAMATGFVALAAARAAASGADLDTVAAAATSAVDRGHAYIVLQRLDNLRRSGRIRGATAWLGTRLAIKPLLRIDDGKLVLAQRVRTTTKAVAAMVDQVCELVGDRPAAVAVHHVANPDGAAQLAETLAGRLLAAEPAIVTDLGPLLALHVGGGALGVCVDVDLSAGGSQA